ncbi:MAG: hypothetical protein KAS05_04060 [Candidatus Omnitrophica bacterium]|nr:hypothetical protein [Candidatus Omnitrophota bacterium]
MLIKLKKSQSTAEYAILISVIVGAALAMQVYIKRSLQAKMHDAGIALTEASGDITGDGVILGTTKQYEPYYAEQRLSDVDRETSISSSATTSEGGALAKTSEQDIDVTSSSVEQSHILVMQE